MTNLLIRTLSADEINSRIEELSAVLIDCVAGGASVSFMHPLSPEKARLFWQGVAQSVERQERVVIVAQYPQGQVMGTVQLISAQPENQPHRADVAKLLVHRQARRGGVAQGLMQYLEEIALQLGKNVLVLDTVTGSGAEFFYQQAGWQRVGSLPDYALMPDGALCATTFFYKHLSLTASDKHHYDSRATTF